MYKLLIVDDEPLVQIGIKSMLDWSSLDISIIGCAGNGAEAFEIIQNQRPDIVLTDIKMPMMSGMELLKLCRETDPHLPVFIFMTSYDEFSLVKEAIKYEALDYLVKLEIDHDVLSDVLLRAIKKIQQYGNKPQSHSNNSIQVFYEKFMIRLLNNLFDTTDQFDIQARELQLKFEADNYTVVLCSLVDETERSMTKDQQLNLYFSAVQMVLNSTKKQLDCYPVSLDPKRFCLIVKANKPSDSATPDIVSALETSFDIVYRYFNIHIYAGIGRSCNDPILVCESYQDARQVLSQCTREQPILSYQELVDEEQIIKQRTFNLGVFRNDIRLAFESFDADSFETTLNAIIDLFSDHPSVYLQAMDAASNILYLTLTLLPNSRETLDTLFADENDGYRCLYTKTRTDGIIVWLKTFRDGITHLLKSQHKTYKNHMIKSIQDYIDDHITDKLTLNDIASLFAISPNYLSILFKKTTAIGFNEYITSKKIALAKLRLAETDQKIYEIAEDLGFESAFYFSKVFKKIEGIPPKEYSRQIQRQS